MFIPDVSQPLWFMITFVIFAFIGTMMILCKWLIGATHHGLHHKQFKYNFGLYFTFWDKWKKTESPLFEETFESATTVKSY